MEEFEMPQTEEFNEYRKWWTEHGCHCEGNNECYYVGNGERDDCEKHHWRCIKCDKIKQVG